MSPAEMHHVRVYTSQCGIFLVEGIDEEILPFSRYVIVDALDDDGRFIFVEVPHEMKES